jgi:hypothetical protein
MEIRKIEVACAVVFRRMKNYGACFLQANIVKEILEENMGYKPELIYGYASDRDGTYIRHFWLELDGIIIDPSTLSLPHKPLRKLSKIPFNGECFTPSRFQSIQQKSFNMAKNGYFWQDMEINCGVEEVQKYKFIKQQLKPTEP